MYLWLKFLHVLTVLALAAGDIGATVVVFRARRSGSAREILAVMKDHALLVRAGVIPGAIGSMLTGLALGFTLGVQWTDLWVAGTLLGWLLSFLIGVLILVPSEQRALAEAERLVAAGMDTPTPELRHHVGAPFLQAAEWATVVLLVGIVYLMVLKPTLGD